jgi:hypothetical protein
MQDRGRDDLIDDVQNGRMSPEAAEEEAVRLGLPPLARVPDPASYNPMGETWWTLVMAIAWIAWRSPRKVCEFWDTYRRECWDWHYRGVRQGPGTPVQGRWFLKQREPATLSRLILEANYDKANGLLPNDWISVEAAKAKLWKPLSDNVMQATGMERPNGEERVSIPDHEWCDLAPFQRKGRTVLLVRKGQSVAGASGYNDVMVLRQSVMALWPLDRREECDKLLPPTMSPDGPGYMPLYCAAQWIATQGGNFTFDPHHTPNWHAPYADLRARISSGEVTVTGVWDGIGGKLDPHLFASVRVAYPFSYEPLDLILSEDLYLASCAYINEEHWRAGSDDNLQNRRGVKVARIQVLKTDVVRWWPFGPVEAAAETSAVAPTSGAPGRPSSMHLVEDEHRARWEHGDALPGVAKEARALHDWFRKAHPDEKPPTARTIENRIRAEHRRRNATPRN